MTVPFHSFLLQPPNTTFLETRPCKLIRARGLKWYTPGGKGQLYNKYLQAKKTEQNIISLSETQDTAGKKTLCPFYNALLPPSLPKRLALFGETFCCSQAGAALIRQVHVNLNLPRYL